jgi:hypothetical protein
MRQGSQIYAVATSWMPMETIKIPASIRQMNAVDLDLPANQLPKNGSNCFADAK